MKKLLIAATALVALAAPAAAADLPARMPVKAAPMMMQNYDWSGFYLGVNGGYGTSRKCWDIVATVVTAEGCHDATGGMFGGQVGYRFQSAAWVFGLEAQGDWARLRGSNPSTPFGGRITNSTQIDGLALFTGQVGYAFGNVLLYVKGGAAMTWDKYDASFTGGALINSAKETRLGAVVGAGLEYSFTQNWSAAIEYDHLFMGTRDLSFTGPLGTDTIRIKQDVDMITGRINYRFGGAGPVVARY